MAAVNLLRCEEPSVDGLERYTLNAGASAYKNEQKLSRSSSVETVNPLATNYIRKTVGFTRCDAGRLNSGRPSNA